MKGDAYSALRGSRQTSAGLSVENALRIYSRQAARFELLDSQSLCGIHCTTYEYVSIFRDSTKISKTILNGAFLQAVIS